MATVNVDLPRFQCSYCSYRSSTWRELNRHYFVTHSNEPNFLRKCVVAGCAQTFRCYSSYNSHLSRKHKGKDFEDEARKSLLSSGLCIPEGRTVNTGSSSLSTSDGPGEAIAADIMPFDCMETTEVDDDGEMFDPLLVQDHLSSSDRLQRSAALLLLTAKERYQLTQSALSFIVCQVQQMFSLAVDDIDEIVKKNPTAQGMWDSIPDLETHLEALRDPFRGLETEYMQTRFYRESFHLVEPVTIKLGGPSSNDTFQYVPLLQGLTGLLQHSEICDEVLKDHSRTDGLIGDYCDGSFVKNDPYFQANPNALQLLLYFDEVEVCDVLASHRGVHKLGLFYYTIANLRPALRSTHRCIQLVAAITSSLIKQYGFDAILKPFIDDVNQLYVDGITVETNGITNYFCGTVVAFLADTLAAHEIGGFKVGVGFALRKCRICLATQDTIQTKFIESAFSLRNPVSHDHHCSLLDGSYAEADSTTYGVNGKSALNKIPNFHVTNGQMPQDIMHVLLEGAVPFEIKLLLKEFIYNKKYFELSILNERVSSFQYGRKESRTKLPKRFEVNQILRDSSLNLSASQVWTFAIVLPLIIGHMVPEDDLHWECYLLLLQIVQYCTARVTSHSSSTYLTALIDQHHQIFIQCYPGVNILPKMHYLVHVPNQILRLGPLVTSWCMRMEAKNSYFKKVSRLSNFKNVSYSVATRHQKLLCGYLQSTKFFNFDELECGPCKEPLSLGVHPNRDKLLDILPDLHSDAIVSRPNWMRIFGEEYHCGDYLVVGKQLDDLPVFSKIVDLYSISSYPVVYVNMYRTCGLSNHLMSYQLEATLRSCCIALSRLPDHHPNTAHTYVDGKLYITVRSHIEVDLLEVLV